jgi:hypothetical protein
MQYRAANVNSLDRAERQRRRNPFPSTAVVWVCSVPPKALVEGLVSSLWHCWEVLGHVGGRA